MICAIIALEFVRGGRCEISSFQALSRGMICIAETIASAAGVLNSVGVVTIGSGPRIRPSWFMRSARAALASTANSKAVKTAAPYAHARRLGFVLHHDFAEKLGEALRTSIAAIFEPHRKERKSQIFRFQIPNKIQDSKFQNPKPTNPHFQSRDAVSLDSLALWFLVIVWNVGFGAWDFRS